MTPDEDAVVVLGIDVGTTNTKAALVRVVPGASGQAVREIATATTPTPDGATDLVDAVRRVVSELAVRAGGGPQERPAAVGIASMAETGVPLDASGEPLTALLRWDGHRAGTQAADLGRTHGADALFAATGVRVSAKVPLATWAWLADQGVRLHRWAGTADLVALALTGRLVTDHTLAGRTMAYRVVPERPGRGDGADGAEGADRADGPLPRAFDADLLATVGLTPGQLPEVAAPDAVGGYVGGPGSRDGRGIAGSLRIEDFLRPGTPVVVAGHDHAVGAWAGGARRPGDRADSLGTAEAVLTVLEHAPDPGTVARAGMSWVRTASGQHHALLAGSSSAGAMLTWLEEHVGGEVGDALAAAADLDPGRGPVVLPYLAGRQTPVPDPAARVGVVDLDGRRLSEAEVRTLGEREPARLALAVLLGVCLQARWMLDTQRDLGGPGGAGAEAPLLVLGGAARTIESWARTKHRVTHEGLAWTTAREPVATGAAVLAAARAGLLGDPATALRTAPTLALHVLDPTHRPVPVTVLDAFVRAATSAADGT